MTLRPRDAFEKLEPPPGGLARLRARLDTPPSQRRWVWVVAAATLAGVLALVFSRPSPRPLVDPEAPTLIALGLGRMPEGAAAIPPGEPDEALLRVPTSDSKVVFYLVASATPLQ